MASPLLRLLIFFIVMFGVPLVPPPFQSIATISWLLMTIFVWVGSTFSVIALRLSLQSPTSSRKSSLNIPPRQRFFVLITLLSLSKPQYVPFVLIVTLFTKLLLLTPHSRMVSQSENTVNSLISLAHYSLRYMPHLIFGLTPLWLLPSAPLGGAIPCYCLLPTSSLFSLPARVFGCITFVQDHSPSLSKLAPRCLKGVFVGYSRT